MEEVTFQENLSDRMRVTVKEWEGECRVDIRNFYETGKRKRAVPTRRGVSMTLEEWGYLKGMMEQIDAGIEEIEELIADTEEAREEEEDEQNTNFGKNL